MGAVYVASDDLGLRRLKFWCWADGPPGLTAAARALRWRLPCQGVCWLTWLTCPLWEVQLLRDKLGPLQTGAQRVKGRPCFLPEQGAAGVSGPVQAVAEEATAADCKVHKQYWRGSQTGCFRMASCR